MTPSKFKELGWDETVKVCRDYTHAAIQTLAKIPRSQTSPLRFTYISGHFTSRPGAGGADNQAVKDHGLVGMVNMRVSQIHLNRFHMSLTPL